MTYETSLWLAAVPLLLGFGAAFLIRVWNGRYDGRSVTLTLSGKNPLSGSTVLTVTGYSPKDTDRIVRDIGRLLTPVLRIPDGLEAVAHPVSDPEKVRARFEVVGEEQR